MSYLEVSKRRADAVRASSIKKSRTKKHEGYQEWSWRERQYHDCNIFPGVLNQGNRSTCQFCATTSAGQMELNAKFARLIRLRCSLKLEWESLVTHFLELHGFTPEQGETERESMEQTYIEGNKSIYDMDDAVPWCFETLGVFAHGDNAAVLDPLMSATNMYLRFSASTENGIKEKLEKSRLVAKDRVVANLGIDGYERFEDLTEHEVWNYVEEGRAVVTGVLAGALFDFLQPDEIYAWVPKVKIAEDGKREWVDKPVSHAILLMGNADAGRAIDFEIYHPFLNSYGDRYAAGGVGSVFAKALFGGFTLLEMSGDKLKHVTTRMCDLADDYPRPKLNEDK